MPIERAWDRSWSREWQRGFDQTGFGAAGLTVSISVPSSTNAASWTATFTFSDDVTGFVVGDINVTNGGATGFSGSGKTYTALITPTAEGLVTVEVPADAAIDAASNGNLVSQETSTYDTTDPDITITGLAAYVTGPFTATFTFDEAVNGFDVSDIAVGNGVAGSFAAVSQTVYTAVITPTAPGSVTLDVAANAAQDLAGNNSTVATQVSGTFDNVSPTAAITGVPASTSSAFTATVTFSEDVTGFTVDDVIVTNATKSSFTAVSPTVYTVSITGIVAGDIDVNVLADAAIDVASNGNLAATKQTAAFTVSTFDPTDLSATRVWLDLTDLANMYQETTGAAATTAAVVDSPVGTIFNKGTMGGYSVAPNDAARGTLRTDGSVFWIETTATTKYSIPISGHASSTATFGVAFNPGADDYYILLYGDFADGERMVFADEGSTSTAMHGAAGAPTIRLNGVAQAPTTRDDLYDLFLNTDSALVIENANTVGWNELQINGHASVPMEGKLFHVVMNDAAFTGTERADLEGFLSASFFSSVAPLSTPTLSWIANDAIFDIGLPADLAVGDIIRMQVADDAGFSTNLVEETHTITAEEYALAEYDFVFPGLSVGTYHTRVKLERPSTTATSEYSDSITFTLPNAINAPTNVVTGATNDTSPELLVSWDATVLAGDVIKFQSDDNAGFASPDLQTHTVLTDGPGNHTFTFDTLVDGTYYTRARSTRGVQTSAYVTANATVAFGYNPQNFAPLIWVDPSDIGTLRQEITGLAATTPVAVGDPVGTLLNKGSDTVPFVAPSTGVRGTLELVGGKYVIQPVTGTTYNRQNGGVKVIESPELYAIAGFKSNSVGSFERFVSASGDGSSDFNNYRSAIVLGRNLSDPNVEGRSNDRLSSVALPQNTKVVFESGFSDTEHSLARDGGADGVTSYTPTEDFSVDLVAIFGRGAVDGIADMDFYGLIMHDSLPTTTERGDLESYMTARTI